MTITFEYIKEGRHWNTYMLTNNGCAVHRTWLCAFEDCQLQDGLLLCRQFAKKTRKNIEQNSHTIAGHDIVRS